jgi:hypothetical protein
MANDKCPYCKDSMSEILISKNKNDTIKSNSNVLCDPELGIYFVDIQCKNFI